MKEPKFGDISYSPTSHLRWQIRDGKPVLQQLHEEMEFGNEWGDEIYTCTDRTVWRDVETVQPKTLRKRVKP